MAYSDIKVLLLDGGSRQVLPILYDLKELGCNVTTLNSSKYDNGYTSRFPDVKLIVDGGRDDRDKYQEGIDREIRSGKYDVVIPLGDQSTDYVTKNENEYKNFAALGCAPRECFVQAYDKQRTFEKCSEIGVPCPYTRMINQDINDFINNAHFPIIIKPRSGTGSIGFRKFDSVQMFYGILESGRIDIDEYVVQECVVDFKTRYYVNVFIDCDEVVKSVVSGLTTRWFPIDAGAGSMCQTKHVPEVIDLALKLLKSMHWRGFAQVDFFLDPYDNKKKIIEINGRIPAGIKTNRVAGVSLGRQLVENALGLDVFDYGMDFKEDIITRCLQTDILWFMKSPYRFRSTPSWFRFWQSHDVIFSWKDPIPFFVYSVQHLKTMRTDIKKRDHQ